MSTLAKMPPPGFDALSIDEKIEYVQLLWDHISADAATVPVPAWQKEILEERMAELEAHPDSVVPWEEVFDRVSREIRSSEDPVE
jgi:putative addiction module component (TIGR02574 family)